MSQPPPPKSDHSAPSAATESFVPDQASPAKRTGGSPRRPSWLGRLLDGGQFVIALAATVGFLVYLLMTPVEPVGESPPPTVPQPLVWIDDDQRIQIEAGSPFDSKIETFTVRLTAITDPLLTATGRVVASLRPGSGDAEDYWQFESAEVLTAFTEWQRALADIAFAQRQLEQTRQLNEAKLNAQRGVVSRLRNLVSSGTEAPRDLANEEANLIQMGLEAERDVYAAETAVQVARRAEAAALRILQQEGIDASLLSRATSDIDIVLADVPEGKIDRVKIGQSCEAKFVGLTGEKFTGKVNSIAPVLSKERRSLRVLFAIDDLEDKLRPGMFAEIGLGTDPRETLLIPADAILHVDRGDYVLVSSGGAGWRVAEVQVGEPRNGAIEIIRGLQDGDRVISRGAILLKPLVVRVLQHGQEPAQR